MVCGNNLWQNEMVKGTQNACLPACLEHRGFQGTLADIFKTQKSQSAVSNDGFKFEKKRDIEV